MVFYRFERDLSRCKLCGFCEESVFCPGSQTTCLPSCEECVSCQACYQACPHQAIEKVVDRRPRRQLTIKVNGESFLVPERITVKRALELIGYKISPLPLEDYIFVPCSLGGCFACAFPINGEIQPICITPASEGMEIRLELPADYTPLRRVSGYMPHPAGGVGTPWWVKKSGRYYIEVACFAHGCNLRCYQCQNFGVTYDNVERPSTPREAAEKITTYRRQYGVKRIAISGGEPTLNKPWLIAYFQELKKLNPRVRLHLDTNASILDPTYVDELVEAGVTDIGPDLKGLHVETFMEITGIRDRRLAETYLKNAWNIVKYIVDNYYPEKLFTGVGVPYNRRFITLQEIREIGDELFKIHPELQVTLLDYFPTFRRRDMSRPSVDEMKKARETLKESGLKVVLAQTILGTIGP